MSGFKRLVGWMATATAAHVGFAFFVMGGWAIFANRAHAPCEAITAGLAQGAMSGAITLVLKKGLEWMNARLKGAAALIAPPTITATAILFLLISVHTAIGTPEIAATIAVPFSVSTLYAFVYNLGLWRRANGR